MSLFQMVFLAFVQAATEFLPVSSSGHLLFFKGLFHAEEMPPLIFDIVLHVGSLFAIVVFYFKRLVHTFKTMGLEIAQKKSSKPATRFVLYGVLATCVTFGIYLLFDDAIEAMTQKPEVLGWTFGITTVILLSTLYTRKCEAGAITQKSWLAPVVIGLFQGLAIIPGISRSGSTVSASLLLKIKKDEAAYFSFFLAIPAILGALVFKLTEIEQSAFLLEQKLGIAIAFLVSAVFSYLFLRLLVWVIQKGKFWMFALYTGVMAIVSLILF